MRHGRRPRERGVALLLVLWVFVALGVLALDFSQYIRDDALAATNFKEEAEGYYVALAGMNHALFLAQQRRERGGVDELDAPDLRRGIGREARTEQEELEQLSEADGQWHEGTFAGMKYRVRMEDEGGKIALNYIQGPLLTRIVTNLIQRGDATRAINVHVQHDLQVIVNSILDWRDTDNLLRQDGAENEYYLNQRPPHRAKNGLFDSPDELLMVRGMTRELFYGSNGVPGLRDIVSVYSRSPRINIRTAPAAVLQVLLNTDPTQATDMVTGRGEDKLTFLPRIKAQVGAVDPQIAELLHEDEARIVMLEGRADVSRERNQASVAAVVDLSGEGAEGVRIIRWLDRAPRSLELPTMTGVL